MPQTDWGWGGICQCSDWGSEEECKYLSLSNPTHFISVTEKSVQPPQPQHFYFQLSGCHLSEMMIKKKEMKLTPHPRSFCMFRGHSWLKHARWGRVRNTRGRRRPMQTQTSTTRSPLGSSQHSVFMLLSFQWREVSLWEKTDWNSDIQNNEKRFSWFQGLVFPEHQATFLAARRAALRWCEICPCF